MRGGEFKRLTGNSVCETFEGRGGSMGAPVEERRPRRVDETGLGLRIAMTIQRQAENRRPE